MKFIYYNHSYITEMPEIPIKTKLKFKDIEKNCLNPVRNTFFASYITEFDCKENTDWWFTIKDDSYDLSKLNSHDRRNVISYKKKCFAKKIIPIEYTEKLFDCYQKSFNAYPLKYRPTHFSFEDFKENLKRWSNPNSLVYACFLNETDDIIGFSIVQICGNSFQMDMQKTDPEYENCRSSAALMDIMLNEYNEIKKENSNFYVSNGTRSIKHQTNFNLYLEKYFGFRKAYAKLRIVYKFPIGIIVAILKPFMFLLKNSRNPFLYNVYCVLKMDSFKYKEK